MNNPALATCFSHGSDGSCSTVYTSYPYTRFNKVTFEASNPCQVLVTLGNSLLDLVWSILTNSELILPRFLRGVLANSHRDTYVEKQVNPIDHFQNDFDVRYRRCRWGPRFHNVNISRLISETQLILKMDYFHVFYILLFFNMFTAAGK